MRVSDLSGAHLGRDIEAWSDPSSTLAWRVNGRLVGVTHQKTSEDADPVTELHLLLTTLAPPSFVTVPSDGGARVSDLS